ncbi:hypothetical protein FA95DRAFT_1610941 [Auriscalpium vulgare]|uniref:Uncharacterized protein n=1 Tax=Auriscalpium vulgare TaxID=40419 RepID=A0ACB8RBV5_9AGAM|nr:hypothetical protein FA95DRAFT_1610941 [Auriscalpium vulgare]
MRPYNNPRLGTFREVLALATQIIEGVEFMHERHITHRDFTTETLSSSERMYPNESFRPVKMNRSTNLHWLATSYTRTQRPSRALRNHAIRGSDNKSVPELRGYPDCPPYNSFPTDIYSLGWKRAAHRFRTDIRDKPTRIFHNILADMRESATATAAASRNAKTRTSSVQSDSALSEVKAACDAAEKLIRRLDKAKGDLDEARKIDRENGRRLAAYGAIIAEHQDEINKQSDEIQKQGVMIEQLCDISQELADDTQQLDSDIDLLDSKMQRQANDIEQASAPFDWIPVLTSCC